MHASLAKCGHVLCWAGGVADALNEQYNDQLRELRASGAADSAAATPLREALRALRDQPRCAGSVKAWPPLQMRLKSQGLTFRKSPSKDWPLLEYSCDEFWPTPEF